MWGGETRVKLAKTIGAGITALAGVAVILAGVTAAPAPTTHAAPAGDQVTVAARYVLRDWQGRLAVFREGAAAPEQVYEDVAVATLPPAEQQRLRQGVIASDRAALCRLLEDYTS